MSGLRDFIQATSNAAASNVSIPVDGIAWLMRKAGLPIPDAPMGGSDWMEQKGLTRPAGGIGGLLGEMTGGLLPVVAAAKAPQIARGLLKAGDNLMAPSTLNKQSGVIGWDGLQDRDNSKMVNAWYEGLYTDTPQKVLYKNIGLTQPAPKEYDEALKRVLFRSDGLDAGIARRLLESGTLKATRQEADDLRRFFDAGGNAKPRVE